MGTTEMEGDQSRSGQVMGTSYGGERLVVSDCEDEGWFMMAKVFGWM